MAEKGERANEPLGVLDTTQFDLTRLNVTRLGAGLAPQSESIPHYVALLIDAFVFNDGTARCDNQ